MTTFTSFAQNFEDVILWRVFKNISSGFYIDVGANDPVVDSVSYALYQIGWRGIHVEPVPGYARRLRASRPDETVVEAAISESPEELLLYDIANTGMSTGRQDIANRHMQSGFDSEPIRVKTKTLEEILGMAKDKDVHWLKIDVEGMEACVLKSWGASAVRPWVVVVECVDPNSKESNFQEWESHLVSRGYEPAYFDGLNRFYLHHAHAELRAGFDAPPNILDNFILTEASGFARGLAEKIAAAKAETHHFSMHAASRDQEASKAVDAMRIQAEAFSDALSEHRNELVRARAEIARLQEGIFMKLKRALKSHKR